MADAPKVHPRASVLAERLRRMFMHTGREPDNTVLVTPAGRVVRPHVGIEAREHPSRSSVSWNPSQTIVAAFV